MNIEEKQNIIKKGAELDELNTELLKKFIPKKIKWQPLNEYMLVEQYQGDIQGLVLPDDLKVGEGDTFIVIAVGPGWYTDNGNLIHYDIHPGDRVMVAGKIMRVPGEKRLLLCRQADALAIQRESISANI